MKQIVVGMKVTPARPMGILKDGVVLRIDPKSNTAGVMWKLEDGLLTSTVPLQNLVEVVENEQ